MKIVHKYSGLVSYLMFYTSICSDQYDDEGEITHVVFRFSLIWKSNCIARGYM